MPNFVALWVRLIAIILLVVVFMAAVLFFGKKKSKKWEKIASVCMAVLLVLLGIGSTLKSLIAPDVKTIIGTYENELRVRGPSPFHWEYCFVSENEKVYLELDSISKNIIYDDDFEKGEEYTISYETQSNLIVAISQNS